MIRLFIFLVLTTPSALPQVFPADLSFFKTVFEANVPSIQVSTPVKAFLPRHERYDVAVIDADTGFAQPWIKIGSRLRVDTVVATSALFGKKEALTDDAPSTFAEFDFDASGGTAFVIMSAPKPIRATSLTVSLPLNVVLPKKAALFAEVGGEWKTALASTNMYSTQLIFPSTVAERWKLEFILTQPLRISEIDLSDESPRPASSEAIVWLAQPGKRYLIYADAETPPTIETSEAGDLHAQEQKALEVPLTQQARINPLFKHPDDDKDGVATISDNCPMIANSDQRDNDGNLRGDACEDHDGDGFIGSHDNCPNVPNALQEDRDADGIGDACDETEDRLTEKLPWLPWAAMGVVALVVIGILISTLRGARKNRVS